MNELEHTKHHWMATMREMDRCKAERDALRGEVAVLRTALVELSDEVYRVFQGTDRWDHWQEYAESASHTLASGAGAKAARVIETAIREAHDHTAIGYLEMIAAVAALGRWNAEGLG